MDTWLLGSALVLALGALVFVEYRRRLASAEFARTLGAADALRDNVWRLEAAAAARDKAEAASEAKSRFLATVSHEIRTPLAGIIGTADLLAALPLDGEAASYVAALRTSGTALGTLIDEILDFIARYRVPLLAVSISFFAVMMVRELRQSNEDLDALEDAIDEKPVDDG